jgi:hypothetical protein
MNAKSGAVFVLFSVIVASFGEVDAQITIVSCYRQSMARVLTNNCGTEWDTQIETCDTTGLIDQEVSTGLSGIASTFQESNLEVTDSTIVGSGTAMALSEYYGDCFPPPVNAERHICTSEYKIIFSIADDAIYSYGCNLSTVAGSNKFLLTGYPSGPVLVNEYGNVASSGSGPLPGPNTYQLYVNASVNVCWYCAHYNAAEFEFDFSVALEGVPVRTESQRWSAIKALYR